MRKLSTPSFLAFLFSFMTVLLTSLHISHAAVEIVATVNGKPITNYDVEQRAIFLQRSTNIEVTDENRQRLQDDALQMLIDDALKLQAAIAIRPEIEGIALPRAKELIDDSFGTNEQSGSQVLRNRGLDPMTVQTKYVADLAWSDFLRTSYRDKLEAINNKVDAELERLVESASQPQIRLSEIVLSPGPTRTYVQSLELAGKMVEAIHNGADFAAIAEQYSASGTNQNGGRIGWVVLNRLPKIFSEALATIENGEITEALELDGAVYIFKKEGFRENGLADSSQERLWLARAILPVPSDATNPDRLEAAAKIERDTSTIEACDDLTKLHNRYGSGAVSNLNEMVFADLAPQMQRLVTELKVGQPSEPLAFAEGVAVFMACKREQPKIELPSREEIENSQMEKLFGAISERHLIRLRRTAVIDFKF